ncbi:hypothetical protein F4804DRAFT_188994 [Jackrogersella minutella]|nr:hypothetical protein F4804DRAFT_188994 [Jackrogersella minutella]
MLKHDLSCIHCHDMYENMCMGGLIYIVLISLWLTSFDKGSNQKFFYGVSNTNGFVLFTLLYSTLLISCLFSSQK